MLTETNAIPSRNQFACRLPDVAVSAIEQVDVRSSKFFAVHLLPADNGPTQKGAGLFVA